MGSIAGVLKGVLLRSPNRHMPFAASGFALYNYMASPLRRRSTRRPLGGW